MLAGVGRDSRVEVERITLGASLVSSEGHPISIELWFAEVARPMGIRLAGFWQ